MRKQNKQKTWALCRRCEKPNLDDLPRSEPEQHGNPSAIIRYGTNGSRCDWFLAPQQRPRKMGNQRSLRSGGCCCCCCRAPTSVSSSSRSFASLSYLASVNQHKTKRRTEHNTNTQRGVAWSGVACIGGTERGAMPQQHPDTTITAHRYDAREHQDRSSVGGAGRGGDIVAGMVRTRRCPISISFDCTSLQYSSKHDTFCIECHLIT